MKVKINTTIKIIIYENEQDATDNTKLRNFNKLCKFLTSKNICIRRFSFVEEREWFRKNEYLWHLIFCAGSEMLPATYVNDRIQKIEEYPTKKEIFRWMFDN